MSFQRRIGLLTSWASRSNGGVFEAVAGHAALLAKAGYEPQVFALADEFDEADRGRFGDTSVSCFQISGPRQFGYAPSLLPALKLADLDVLHLHGIWMYPSIAGSDWAALTGRPYVISPHGMLDGWITRQRKFKKWMARLAYERRSWRNAALFHALTADEAVDIRREAGDVAISIIPNAVQGGKRVPGDYEKSNIIYIGRIHPKKNLDSLVQAWATLERMSLSANVRLLIAGWGNPDHVAALEKQLASLPKGLNISFVGPIYGAAKDNLIGSARFLVLPSYSEGLPVSVLEGWALGTPSLISTCCHLPDGIAAGAAIDCGTQSSTILSALARAVTLDECAWKNMSNAAIRLISEQFSIDVVAQRWRELYESIVD